MESIDTVIIGGGQAGLAMSHHLTRLGLAHVVLERYRIAERWRTERWDSLRFQFPNWAMRLPDFPYSGSEPDAYAPRDDVVRFIERYAAFIKAPVRTGIAVGSLRQEANAFVLRTNSGVIVAQNVVIATGPYQKPAIPAAAQNLPSLIQVTAADYSNPDQLPAGGVLVVGSGASGVQIAEELLQSGRPVFLSVSAHRRVPRRYRGKDYFWWRSALGWGDRSRLTRVLVSGANGGHTIDLRALAAGGMTLLGRLRDAQDGTVSFADDLARNLAEGDEAYAAFLRSADAHAAQHGLALPEDQAAQSAGGILDPEPIEALDLRASGITSVIWATGYRYDFDWVKLNVFTPVGQPVHRRGITSIPGAYFLGLQSLHNANSTVMAGVGDDAAFLAEQIADYGFG